MKDRDRTREQLLDEIEELREQIAELEKSEIERKEAKTRLCEWEAKWHSIVKNVPNIIMTVDQDGKILFINRTVSGITIEQAIGKSVYDYISPEHLNTVRESLEQVFENGKCDEYEIAGVGPHGRTSWYMSRIAPVKQGRQVVAAVIIARDITEQKKTEEALEESEEKYRLLIDSSDAAITFFDENGTYLFLNKIAAGWLKGRPEDYVGKTVHDTFTKDFADVFVERLRRIIKSGVGENIEEVVEPLDNRWISSNVQPVREKDGKIIGVQSIMYDFTERKLIYEGLQRSENRYRTLVESSPDIIYTVHPDNMIEYINHAVGILEYKPKDLIGKKISTIIHPDDTRLYSRYFQDGSRDDGAAQNLEIRLLTKSSKVRYALVRCHGIYDYPVQDLEEKYLGSIGIMRDITERVKEQREKERLQRQLSEAEKMATLGQFTSSIAHELNNNLDILLTKLFFLQKSFPEGDQHSDAWDQIVRMKQQLFRMSHLAKSILNYVKPRSTVFEPIDMSILLNQVVDSFSDQISLSMFMNLNCSPDLPLIQGDRFGLEIVFKNILLNSIESLTKPGEISIDARKGSDEELEIVIRDSGKGISKKDLRMVFDPFFSTKRKTGGTGLGLPICKRIIEEHRGSIAIESRWNRGTTVFVRLPIIK